jgi:hypothetical protein
LIHVGISTDLIAGFCDETEEEHKDTLSLVREVQFDQAFTYSYSRREQTFAGLFYQDNVDDADKARRLTETIDTFQHIVSQKNSRLEVGRLHLVLVEGKANAKKSNNHDTNEGDARTVWTGRTDTNKRVIFSHPGRNSLPLISSVQDLLSALDDETITRSGMRTSHVTGYVPVDDTLVLSGRDVSDVVSVKKSSYAVVLITSCKGHTLRGLGIGVTAIALAHSLSLPSLKVIPFTQREEESDGDRNSMTKSWILARFKA